MALNYSGTKVSLTAPFIPAGYTRPAVATFDDAFYKSQKAEITIVKSLVENSDTKQTLTDLVAAIGSEVITLLANDYDDAANTIDAYSEFTSVTLNSNNPKMDFYTNTPSSYVCSVIIYVKIS